VADSGRPDGAENERKSDGDGLRIRGWWFKRYGRRLSVVGPPIRGVRPNGFITVMPHDVVIGVCWYRNDDDEWEVVAGVGFITVDVTFFEVVT
jgi:hypothetical protein